MTLTPPQIEVLRKLPADGSDYILMSSTVNDPEPWLQLAGMGLIEGRRWRCNLTPSGIEALKEIEG